MQIRQTSNTLNLIPVSGNGLAMNNNDNGSKTIGWHVRTVNILANSGMYFAIPYAGSAIAQVPSIEVAGFSMMIGLIISASKEGLEFVKEHS